MFIIPYTLSTPVYGSSYPCTGLRGRLGTTRVKSSGSRFNKQGDVKLYHEQLRARGSVMLHMKRGLD